jgi:CPA2 family monovalent cation:H+ antiporter-2
MIFLASSVQIPFLTEIIVVLGLSILVIYLFQRLHLPAILGFLATGILFGPHALGLVSAGEEIKVLSEIGVVLLLFIIGLEFSIKQLISIRKVVLIGGSLQVGLTIFVVAALAYLIGLPLNKAVFLGFLFSLSSTAIVLKMVQEKGLMRSPQGRIALGILIFQDIIVVPMMLLTPILAGQGGDILQSLLILLVKFAFVIGMVLVLARYLVPRLLHEIARTRSRELFLITIIVICFAVAYVTSMMGLSLALGAFMAGLCISESEYSHQATGLIIPFREIFTSFFFVSVGMLLDLSFLAEHLLTILLLTLAAFVVKFLVLVVTTMALKYPLKTGLIVGFAMFQVGEFAFILASTGMEFAILDDVSYQYFLAISILTMAATPFLIGYSERFSSGMMRTQMSRLDVNTVQPDVSPVESDRFADLDSHLIIIGYGLNGRNTARVAREANVPYVIVDLEPDAVRSGREAGEPIIYGDANNPHILEMLHVYRARVAVVAISDHEASLGVVSNIREICNTVHIIVRCKTVSQSEELIQIGASEAISEQFETSIEVFARALNQFLVNEDDIDGYVELIRKDTFDTIRSRFHVYKRNRIDLKEVATRSLILGKNCPFSEKHMCEANMLEDHRVRVFGLIRNGNLIKHIDGDTLMMEGDEVILYGREQDLKGFIRDWERDAEIRERKLA